MSQDSESSNHSVHVIVEGGEMLKRLTPSRLATLLFISDDEIETQTEMADILDISTSTITTHLQKLENLPVSLAVRQQQYEITRAGEEVIGLLVRMFNRLEENLHDVDWGDAADRDHIGKLLAPLHKFRSIAPFLVLYSIGYHSTVEGRIGIFAPSQSVRVKDVVADVRSWQEERGETATRKQVRSILSRFEDFGVVEIDGEEVTLEEKGEEQAKLLEQLIELIEDSRATEAGESPPSSTQQDSEPMDTQPTTVAATDDIGCQLGFEEFYEREKEVDTDDNPIIVPAYRVSSPDNEQSSVLPLTPTMTAEELDTQTTSIRREYGDDAQLELFWTTLSSKTVDSDRSNDCSNEHPKP